MKFAMKFEGGDELARELNALSARVSRRVQIEALIQGGEPIRALASHLAPRDPGAPDLADHITIGAVRRRAGESDKDVSVGVGVPKAFFYDWFLEYGTVHMNARAFWRPAFDTKAPPALGVIGQALWTALAGRGIGRSVMTPTRVQSDGPLL